MRSLSPCPAFRPSSPKSPQKAELDRLRPQKPGVLTNLDQVTNIEMTYTSNAIEGNNLNAAETMLVIEQGLTIGGKPLKDQLEAIDHTALDHALPTADPAAAP